MTPGQIISNYEIVSYLGGGGMGEVWLAEDRRINRQVAIKGLHPQLLSNEEVRTRFRNEAVTLAKLQHPNVVGLFDYIENESGSFLIMELVEGEPMDDHIRLKTGPIPEKKAIDLFAQILQGVAYAHQRNIIHRDIKPSNFLIDAYGNMKILDFGIAKVLEEDKGLTKTGTRMGTVFYMSPEQVRGEPADKRSDIYSLGVTLFQMLTGTKPFSQEATEFQIYNDIVSRPLPRAKTIYPAVSDHMQSVMDKATAKHPDQRFQSCAEFLSALTNPDYRYQIGNAPPPPPSGQGFPAIPEEGEENSLLLRKRRRRLRIRTTVGMVSTILLLTLAMIGFSEGWFSSVSEEDMDTPTEVAELFLNAVEENDSTVAYRFADYNCKEQLRYLFEIRALSENTTTTYVVQREYIEGERATVYYNKYAYGNSEEKILNLTRNGRTWQVSCSKEELL